MLARLTDAEALETYIHRAFLGREELLDRGPRRADPDARRDLRAGRRRAARARPSWGWRTAARLNVLAHAVGRPYESILAEFEGEKDIDVITARPRGGTGDVKYHQGAEGESTSPARARQLRVTLASNPSHLEYVDPVVRGPRARRPDRARQAQARVSLPRAARCRS